MIRIIHITLWILLATAIHANASDDLSSKAIGYIRSHPEIVQADLGDLKELRIGGKASGLAGHQYIYVQQQKDGVDIHQASVTVCFGPGQQVLSVHGTFVAHLNEKLKDKGYYLSPGDILSRYQSTYQPGIAINQKVSSKAEYDRTADPRKVWWNISQDEYILVYEIIIHIPKDVRKIIYDASTGEILEDKSLYQACRFEIPASASLPGPSENSSASSEFGDPVNSYRVFPLGSENPSQGDRVLLSNPSDPVASPYGWHDTDGTPGAEFLTTKGNNAEVAEDEDGDNLPGQMADGGASLEFDFPMATDATPMANLNASLTNTFYWMNINHDVFYHYGFQERDGNFQRNNYGQAGLANDPVQVDALDGGNLNNARFYAPADGAPGRLELFLWGANRANLILNRRGQSQKQVTSIESNFGAQNKLQRLGGITGPLSLVIDGDAGTHWGCPDGGLTTGSQISGKIAVVQKGMCPNLDKILNLQEQGATGVIVVNDIPGDPILMNGSGTTVVIPAVKTVITDFSLQALSILVFFALGCIVGLLTFAKFLSWMFKTYHRQTLAAMTGFVVGSLWKIWPWRTPSIWFDKIQNQLVRGIWDGNVSIHDVRVIKEMNVLPANYVGNPYVWATCLAIIAGIALVFLLGRLDKKGL